MRQQDQPWSDLRKRSIGSSRPLAGGWWLFFGIMPIDDEELDEYEDDLDETDDD